MVVNVGSFSDPEGLEGLAHFLGILFFSCMIFILLCNENVFRWESCKVQLVVWVVAEHMLFFSSEKYPEEDSYSKYLTEVSISHIHTCTHAHVRASSVYSSYFVCRNFFLH